MSEAETTFVLGSRVRFKTGPLGVLVEGAAPGVAAAETVGAGTLGTVAGKLETGWLTVRPDTHPTGLVPVAPEDLEPAPAAAQPVPEAE